MRPINYKMENIKKISSHRTLFFNEVPLNKLFEGINDKIKTDLKFNGSIDEDGKKYKYLTDIPNEKKPLYFSCRDSLKWFSGYLKPTKEFKEWLLKHYLDERDTLNFSFIRQADDPNCIFLVMSHSLIISGWGINHYSKEEINKFFGEEIF